MHENMIILQLTCVCSKAKCWLACAGLSMIESLHHGLTSWANLLIHSARSCMPGLGLLKSPDAQKCLLLLAVLPHSYVQQSPQCLS